MCTAAFFLIWNRSAKQLYSKGFKNADEMPPSDLGRRLLKRQVDVLKTLPSFPDSVLRINHEILYNSDDKNFDEIARLIEQDPVVMARTLKLVNSAFYDKAGMVTSVHEALVMLGLDIIRGVILSTVALEFSNELSACEGLWEHSFGVAIAAGILARKVGVERPEDVAAAGLLHDIGKVVLVSQLKSDYEKVVAHSRTHHVHVRESELKVLGVSHDEVGQWLMRRWRLPERLAEPVTYHHRVSLASEYKRETAIVHIANAMVRGYGFGFAADTVMPPVCPEAWASVDISQKLMTAAMQEMHQVLQSNALRLGLDT